MISSPSWGARPSSRRARRAAVGAAVTTLVALLPAVATVTSSASAGEAPARAAVQGSLSVSPSVYVAGQKLRFKGNIGKAGVRGVRLQSNLNRAGDTWNDVPGTAHKTNSHGAFDFNFTAPSMLNIKYRVAGGGLVTSSFLFHPRPQEITVAPPGEKPQYPFYDVTPGSQFTVVADGTPAVRSSLGTAPPIPGRTFHLQERVNGNQWQTIDTKQADSKGEASFDVTAPAFGDLVLRAREDRWTKDGNHIGWYASFPTYFQTQIPAPRPQGSAARPAARPVPTTTPARTPTRPTASERYHWGPSLFDFAWERGQDLSSPPSKGTKRKGAWVDTSDGTGRVMPFNGGLSLQSKLMHTGEGDLGTTTATLKNNTQATGRWEFRLQSHDWESGPRPYGFRLELVPAGSPVTACSPESIVVADLTVGGSGLKVGVRSEAANSIWSRKVGDRSISKTPHNVAVEVAKGHVTWYYDGDPIATVKDADAYLGEQLVPRFSLIGGQQEMNGAQIDSDWQRAWTLAKGQQVKSGAQLTRTDYSDAC